MSTADEAFEATAALDLAADADQRKGAGGGRRRIHPAWWVALVAFVALIGAAGFRAAPGVLMVPLEQEFGWPRTLISSAVSLNLVLYGLMAPFAAALMDRFGIRWVTSIALILVAAGSGLTIVITQGWQLMITWGLLIGLGTGSMALVFAATIANRWFVRRRGLVMGVLTAAGATGQLIFLPVMAALTERQGWRTASLVVTFAALAVVPFVVACAPRLSRGPGSYRVRCSAGSAATAGDRLDRSREPGGARSGRRGTDQDVLGSGRWLRDLRRDHQRPDRHPLRALRP